MENQPTSFATLFENAGNYIETRIDLLKLQAVDKSSDVTSSLIASIATLLVVSFALFLFNIGLALWIGDLLGKTYLGFLIVAGFYVLVALLLHFFRNPWIKDPVTTILIKKMLK